MRTGLTKQEKTTDIWFDEKDPLKMLQRGTPKLGKDGKPMKDKHGKVIYEPYRIKVLNTINFKKSMHYNPFA